MKRKTVLRLIRFVAVLALTVCVMLALSSCRLPNIDIDSITDIDGLDAVNDSVINTGSVSLSDKVYCYYYDQLSSIEKELYDLLLASIEDGTDTVELSRSKKAEYFDAAEHVVEALNYDHSEHFAYSGALSYYEYGDSLYFQMDKWEYWQYSSSYESQKRSLDSVVTEIATRAARNFDNDYERAQFVHDYLVRNAVYDNDALEDVMNHPTSYNVSYQPVFTAYGCLVNEKCVCAGYAHAYKMILDKLGIPCVYVVGWGDPTYTDVGHAWNRIVLDNQSYYVDVTWDDNLFEIFDDHGYQEYPDAATHDYFSITTEELLKTHSIDEEYFTQPVCDSETYNYYNYYGLIVDSYSLDALVDVVNKQKNNNPVSVKFSNPSDTDRAVEDFILNAGYQRVRWLSSFTPYANKSDGYLYLVF